MFSNSPGPADAMWSPTSYSLVTGFPGKTSLIVETVEKTVEDTDDCKVDLNLFNTSIVFVFFSQVQVSTFDSDSAATSKHDRCFISKIKQSSLHKLNFGLLNI